MQITSEMLIEKGFTYDKRGFLLNPDGSKRGCQTRKDRYSRTTLFGKQCLIHRLIYIFHNVYIPSDLEIDHINRDPWDNRIENLRAVPKEENMLNREMRYHRNKHWAAYGNQCGVCKRKGKYIAYITKNKRRIYLGIYKEYSEAVNARKLAEQNYDNL